jgi:drug/metabolite transporter (DMT)-like permease
MPGWEHFNADHAKMGTVHEFLPLHNELSGAAFHMTRFSTIPILRIKADLALLLVSIVWGTAFAVQRIAANRIDVFLFNGLRFLLGALVLMSLAWKTAGGWRKAWDGSRHLLPGMILAGFLLFSGITLQQWGLRYTTAGNAGFITGLYVIIIPLILAILWRQWPRRSVLAASVLAAAGLFLLSTRGQFHLARGDSLELVSAFIWAFHVILIGWLARRVEIYPLAIIQYVVCGLLSLASGGVSGSMSLQGLSEVGWTIVYTAVFSIGLGYTLQAVGQKVAPAADAAIILSMEAVFGALFGWLLLNERLTDLQLLGCGLMLVGMLLAQGYSDKSSQVEILDLSG